MKNTCPFCGFMIREVHDNLYDGDYVFCRRCGNEFIVHPSRKYSNCWGLEPTYKKVDIHNIIKYKNK